MIIIRELGTERKMFVYAGRVSFIGDAAENFSGVGESHSANPLVSFELIVHSLNGMIFKNEPCNHIFVYPKKRV